MEHQAIIGERQVVYSVLGDTLKVTVASGNLEQAYDRFRAWMMRAASPSRVLVKKGRALIAHTELGNAIAQCLRLNGWTT